MKHSPTYTLIIAALAVNAALLIAWAIADQPASSPCPTELSEVKAEFEQLQRDCLLCLQFEERWLMEGGPKSP
jgi:hypothetical protein